MQDHVDASSWDLRVVVVEGRVRTRWKYANEISTGVNEIVITTTYDKKNAEIAQAAADLIPSRSVSEPRQYNLFRSRHSFIFTRSTDPR